MSEAGDYTDKYNASADIIAKYNTVITKLPAAPPESKKVAYEAAPITEQLTYDEILENVVSFHTNIIVIFVNFWNVFFFVFIASMIHKNTDILQYICFFFFFFFSSLTGSTILQ